MCLRWAILNLVKKDKILSYNLKSGLLDVKLIYVLKLNQQIGAGVVLW